MKAIATRSHPSRAPRQPQQLIALPRACQLLGITVHAFEVLRDQGRATIYRLHGKRPLRLVERRQVRQLRRHPRILARAVRAAS